VLAFTTDPDPETRLAVAMAFPGLTGWGDPPAELDATAAERVAATLASLSGDEDGDVRDWALFALARQYERDTPPTARRRRSSKPPPTSPTIDCCRA
jgi:HEAT repeat protein